MELEVLNTPASSRVRLKARQMEQGRRYQTAQEQRYRMEREQRWQREQEQHCPMVLERRFLEESCRLVAFRGVVHGGEALMEPYRKWSCCCYHQHRNRLRSVRNSP